MLYLLGWYSVYLVLLLVPVALAIRAMWQSVTRPRRWKAQPSCELCRYQVVGLMSLSCPECGTDLRRTGIITPAMEMRRRGSFLGGIAGWTLVLFVVTYFAFVACYTWLRSWTVGAATSTSATMPLNTSQPFTPNSRAFTDLTIKTTQNYGTNARTEFELVFTSNDGKQAKLQGSYLGVWTYSGVDAEERPISAVKDCRAADIRLVMLAAGISLDHSAADDEIEEIALAVAQQCSQVYAIGQPTTLKLTTMTAGALSQSGGLNYTYSGTAALPYVSTLTITLTAAGAVWIVGTVLIIWRRRSLLRIAAACEESGLPAVAPQVPLSSNPRSSRPHH